MEIKDFVQLIHEGRIIEDYVRRFSTLTDPCPPEKLLRGRSMTCFFCMDCIDYAKSRVKECKNHYQVNGEKILKEEFNENTTRNN